MSDFLDMPTTGKFLSGKSAKTAVRFGRKHGLPVFLINGRKYFRRADVIQAIEQSEIVAQPKPQASLKTMLQEISSKVLAKRGKA